MSQVIDYKGIEPQESKNYLNAESSISSWLLTVDHKRIGIMYLISIAMFFAIGGVMAGLIRAELLTPAGDLMSSDAYNKAFTIHGVTLIFFFLVPSIPAVLGNFLIPIMIGAKDVAFPRLNLASWYIFMGGAIFTLSSLILGGVDTGWTFYTPYSSSFSNTAVTLAVSGVFMAGFSSIFTGLNFIVTIHKMRAPGLTWHRLPLFVWAQYATSVIMVLGTPVLAITLFLLGVERIARIGIFDPALGGDPVLFQHLFWFYSHPAVYIMIVPSMGVMSELMACFSRNRIFGYDFIAYSSLAIAALSFVVWGHHMFTSGQSIYVSIVFSILSFVVAIPSAVKVFNWTATMYKGRVILDSPMLFALGFMGLFTIGGLTGLVLATLGVDIHMHDTYFVVAHFHYIMVGGAIMGFMGGIHFWWPKMTGRMYPETFGKLSALTIFIGFNLTFFPQFVVGYIGMPRRYHSYPDEYQVWHVLSSCGASILIGGYIMTIAYLLWSLKYGQKAPANPWGAKGLEWTTPSPPPTENFHVMPVVREEAYAYNIDAEEDVHETV
ncbi:MAG: cytochrome c oxidase subunit I [Armatimonadota bacterium]|nr:cytochrome c oxidase subunit I [Armatimonadota bacterium]